MAKRTAEIVLGGDTYTVRAFNMGELERVADAIEEKKGMRVTQAIVRIALERATPPLACPFEEIETDVNEIAEAGRRIMVLAGLTATENPPPADPQQVLPLDAA